MYQSRTLHSQQHTLYNADERKKAVRDIIVYMIDRSPYTSMAGVFELNATQAQIHGFTPEGKSFRWSERYENIWRS